MEIIVAATLEIGTAGEIDRLDVVILCPEPRIIGFVAERLATAIGAFVLLHARGDAKQACLLRPGVAWPRSQEGANVWAHSIINIRFPADGLS